MPRTDMSAELQGLVNQFVAAIGYDCTPNYRPLTVSAPNGTAGCQA